MTVYYSTMNGKLSGLEYLVMLDMHVVARCKSPKQAIEMTQFLTQEANRK